MREYTLEDIKAGEKVRYPCTLTIPEAQDLTIYVADGFVGTVVITRSCDRHDGECEEDYYDECLKEGECEEDEWK